MGGRRTTGILAALAALLLSGAAGADAPVAAPPAAAGAPKPVSSGFSAIYAVRSGHWSETDERDYSRFIAEIGDAGCNTVDKCLHSPRNPFRGSDPPGVYFRSDCADLPYNLRF